MTKHPDRSCLGMLPGVAADTTQAPDQTPTNRLQSRTLIKRHPMAAFLGTAYVTFGPFGCRCCSSGRRLGSSALSGRSSAWRCPASSSPPSPKADPVSAIWRTARCGGESGSPGTCSLGSRSRWQRCSSPQSSSAPPHLQAFGKNWLPLATTYVPQLVLALVTVQFFEELGWAGFAQHQLQARHGALKASVFVALTFALLHLPTYVGLPSVRRA